MRILLAVKLDPDKLTDALVEAYDLTPAQRQVIYFTLMGQTMAQISTRTGKAIRTIKLHRTEAFARLQVGSTGELWGLLFKMAGHELEPLSDHPVRWEELFKTCGNTVDIDRIMRLTGRPRRVVIKKLKEYGYEVA